MNETFLHLKIKYLVTFYFIQLLSIRFLFPIAVILRAVCKNKPVSVVVLYELLNDCDSQSTSGCVVSMIVPAIHHSHVPKNELLLPHFTHAPEMLLLHPWKTLLPHFKTNIF